MYDFNLKDKVAVITGGTGVICSEMARSLAENGVRTVILARNKEKADTIAAGIENRYNVPSIGVSADVTDKESMIRARKTVTGKFGNTDILINGAGGNSPEATTKVEIIGETDKPEDSLFGLSTEGFDKVFDLNFRGTLLPVMVFGEEMIKRKSGVIINISSMNAFRPLTKIPAYSSSKAAVNNFTQWLAVHFARSGVRVNAIAPGFLLTQQNRFLLVDEKTGTPTPRGKKIISNTPMERYGTPEELTGTVLYLASDLSKFVTGIVIPVDGGFNAYSGV